MKKTILTVDDSLSMQQILKDTLSDAGYSVITCSNGVEALAAFPKQPVDMVITDLNMPQMDGITLIARLRQLPAAQYIPIVMLTTESSANKKQEGKQAGASGWITKPFRPDQLVSVAERLLNRA